MTAFRISQITSEQSCLSCFEVMRELRPHLLDASAFATQVSRQTSDGYCLLAAWRDEQVVGLIGYRLQENLINGRFLFVDDLVVRTEERRSGLGAHLLHIVRQKARNEDCQQLVLDTGLGMSLAQRFYFQQGLLTRSIGFYERLSMEPST